MAYRITNQTLGTSIIVDQLPPGVSVGVHDIGPSWDNQPPPQSIVEEIPMIVQDSAGSLYRVVGCADPSLAHVWMGYPVKRSRKTASGYAPKSTNGQARLIRRAGCVVIQDGGVA